MSLPQRRTRWMDDPGTTLSCHCSGLSESLYWSQFACNIINMPLESLQWRKMPYPSSRSRHLEGQRRSSADRGLSVFIYCSIPTCSLILFVIYLGPIDLYCLFPPSARRWYFFSTWHNFTHYHEFHDGFSCSNRLRSYCWPSYHLWSPGTVLLAADTRALWFGGLRKQVVSANIPSNGSKRLPLSQYRDNHTRCSHREDLPSSVKE